MITLASLILVLWLLNRLCGEGYRGRGASQDGPTRFQDGPQSAQNCHNMDPRGSGSQTVPVEEDKDGPRRFQDGPQNAQHGHKMDPRGSREDPR